MKRLLWLSMVLWTGGRLLAGEFQTAAAEGELSRMTRLLEANPALVNQKDRGTTALHEASRKGHLAVVRFLLDNGAEANPLDISKLTPLRLAVAYRHPEVAALLRQHGGVEKIVAGPPPSVPTVPPDATGATGPRNSTPTATPARTTDPVLPRTTRPPTGRAPSTVGTAGTRPAGPTTTDQASRSPTVSPAPSRAPAPTLTASSTNKSVEELVTELPTINDAAKVGDTRTVQRLLELMPDLRDWVDDKGISPLHVAAQNGQNQVIRQLVAAKANPNQANRLGYSPLHLAGQLGSAETVQLLVAARGNPNATDANGITPLHMAARQGNLPVVKALLLAGGDPATRDRWNKTAATYASDSGQAATAQYLSQLAGGENLALARQLEDHYRRFDQLVSRGSLAERRNALVGMLPTQAEVRRLFPRTAGAVWQQVERTGVELKRQVEQGRQLSRGSLTEVEVLTANPFIQVAQSDGNLVSDLPIFTVRARRNGQAEPPAVYCWMNNRWVLVPSLAANDGRTTVFGYQIVR